MNRLPPSGWLSRGLLPASDRLRSGSTEDVYDTKSGWWHPVLGDLEVPDGWEFLGSGDAFITRRVKAGGVYWNAWKPRNRRGGHRRRLGLLAPSAAIATARCDADASAERRAAARVASARHRDRVEADNRLEVREAVYRRLAFLPAHAELASQIADGAAAQATVVGSGRVGRTRTLSVEERAAFAAREPGTPFLSCRTPVRYPVAAVREPGFLQRDAVRSQP